MNAMNIYSNAINACNRKVSDPGTYTIYHYTSPTGLVGIFKENSPKLYFSQYDSLNDYKERLDIVENIANYCDFKVKDNIMSQELSDAIKSIRLLDNFIITEKIEELIELEDGTQLKNITAMKDKDCYTYICSFSLERDLLPMWRMYSKSEHYEGFSLGVYNEIFRHHSCFEKGYSIELRKTIYSNEEKEKLFDELILPICGFYKSATKIEKNNCINLIRNFIYKNQFVFKNQAFEYEKEVRAILHVPKEQRSAFQNISERKYRESNGVFIPFIEFELPKNSVRSINLAPTFKEKIAEQNLKDFLESKGYDNIKVFPSNIPIRGM